MSIVNYLGAFTSSQRIALEKTFHTWFANAAMTLSNKVLSSPTISGNITVSGGSIFDGHVAIGNDLSTAKFTVYDDAVDLDGAYHGFYNYHNRTGGAVDASHDHFGIYNDLRINYNGETVGYVRGIYSRAYLMDGTIGDGDEDHVGAFLSARIDGGVVGNQMHGAYVITDVNGGTVTSDIKTLYSLNSMSAGTVDDTYAGYFYNDLNSGVDSDGDVYGIYVSVDDDSNSDAGTDGTSYILYLHNGSNIDYGVYQVGDITNYFGGTVGIKTNAPDDELHVVGGSGEGDINPKNYSVALFQRNTTSNFGAAITILSGSEGEGAIYFADKDDATAADITYDHADNQMWFAVSEDVRLTISDTNVGVGTQDLGTGGSNALIFANGTFPTGISDGAGLYAKDVSDSGEMFAQGEDGTESQISAHASDAPDWMYDPDIDVVPPEIHRVVNYYTGYVQYINITRDARLRQMERLGEALPTDTEKLKTIFSETFSEHLSRTGESLELLDWDTVQNQIKMTRDDKIARMANSIARINTLIQDELDEKRIKELETEKADILKDVPVPYTTKPMPNKVKNIYDRLVVEGRSF